MTVHNQGSFSFRSILLLIFVFALSSSPLSADETDGADPEAGLEDVVQVDLDLLRENIDAVNQQITEIDESMMLKRQTREELRTNIQEHQKQMNLARQALIVDNEDLAARQEAITAKEMEVVSLKVALNQALKELPEFKEMVATQESFVNGMAQIALDLQEEMNRKTTLQSQLTGMLELMPPANADESGD